MDSDNTDTIRCKSDVGMINSGSEAEDRLDMDNGLCNTGVGDRGEYESALENDDRGNIFRSNDDGSKEDFDNDRAVPSETEPILIQGIKIG